MFTLTLIFNKDKNKVLMIDHPKFKVLNFIGGKVKENENLMPASYRELFEETGITKDDVDLKFLRYEKVTVEKQNNTDVWSMYITCGVLNKDVTVRAEKGSLSWLDLNDDVIVFNSYGDGNCYTFLQNARRLLNI